MEKFNILKEYFEGLANTFLEPYNTNQKFYREHEDLVHFPCLILKYYQGSLSDNGGDGWFQHRTMNFDILFHLHDTANDAKIDDLLNMSEEIGLEIINQIFADSYPRSSDIQIEFDLNSVNWNPVVNFSDHQYGQNFSFSLLVPHPNLVNV